METGKERLLGQNSGDGHHEPEQIPETKEQLEAVKLKLSKLADPDSPAIHLTKEQLGLLKSMITAPESDDKYREALLIADFLDDEEADNFINAIWESKRYGMDIGPDLDWALARAAVNRNQPRTNRVAQIMDTLSHAKFTTYSTQKGKDGQKFSRSPIAER